jgi:hypothetical protein
VSHDLGIRARLVGIAGGFAMITDGKQSRWVDVRTWPPTLLPLRDEVVRGVCAGATLTDRVWTWSAPDKKRTELPRVEAHAVGFLDGKPAVPGQIFDGAWRTVGGTPGAGTHHAITGSLVVWGGRIYRHDGALAETFAGDLPAGDTTVAPTEDGFVTAAGGKLVVVTREGRQREDRAWSVPIDRVLPYEGRWLARAGDRWRLDDAPLDLGSSLPHPRDLIAAPCGLLGIVERRLVRYRV